MCVLVLTKPKPSDTKYRTNYSQVFYRKSALKNFTNFTGKYLCLSFQHRYFAVNFTKFLRALFSQNSCEQLPLQKVDTCMIKCHSVFLINFKTKFKNFLIRFYFYLNMENEIQIIFFNPCSKSIIRFLISEQNKF